MDSIIDRLQLKKTPEQHSLGVLINLVETEYPNEDIDDIDNLCKLLHKEFGVEFTHEDIVNHYVTSLDEEDAKLQYKHLNISIYG